MDPIKCPRCNKQLVHENQPHKRIQYVGDDFRMYIDCEEWESKYRLSADPPKPEEYKG